MYRTLLILLYLLILIPTTIHMIRYREVPSSRRLSAGLGVSGVLLAPTVAGLLCELLVSILSIGIFICGIGMILKALFR